MGAARDGRRSEVRRVAGRAGIQLRELRGVDRIEGIRVDKPDQIGAAWDAAFAADRPCVLDFCTDPEVPPLPPHITIEQAKKFMRSLLRDPSRTAMLKNSMKEMLDAIKP